MYALTPEFAHHRGHIVSVQARVEGDGTALDRRLPPSARNGGSGRKAASAQPNAAVRAEHLSVRRAAARPLEVAGLLRVECRAYPFGAVYRNGYRKPANGRWKAGRGAPIPPRKHPSRKPMMIDRPRCLADSPRLECRCHGRIYQAKLTAAQQGRRPPRRTRSKPSRDKGRTRCLPPGLFSWFRRVHRLMCLARRCSYPHAETADE